MKNKLIILIIFLLSGCGSGGKETPEEIPEIPEIEDHFINIRSLNAYYLNSNFLSNNSFKNELINIIEGSDVLFLQGIYDTVGLYNLLDQLPEYNIVLSASYSYEKTAFIYKGIELKDCSDSNAKYGFLRCTFISPINNQEMAIIGAKIDKSNITEEMNNLEAFSRQEQANLVLGTFYTDCEYERYKKHSLNFSNYFWLFEHEDKTSVQNSCNYVNALVNSQNIGKNINVKILEISLPEYDKPNFSDNYPIELDFNFR